MDTMLTTLHQQNAFPQDTEIPIEFRYAIAHFYAFLNFFSESVREYRNREKTSTNEIYGMCLNFEYFKISGSYTQDGGIKMSFLSGDKESETITPDLIRKIFTKFEDEYEYDVRVYPAMEDILAVNAKQYNIDNIQKCITTYRSTYDIAKLVKKPEQPEGLETIKAFTEARQNLIDNLLKKGTPMYSYILMRQNLNAFIKKFKAHKEKMMRLAPQKAGSNLVTVLGHRRKVFMYRGRPCVKVLGSIITLKQAQKQSNGKKNRV